MVVHCLFWYVYWDKSVCLAHFCFYSVVVVRGARGIESSEVVYVQELLCVGVVSFCGFLLCVGVVL